MDALVRTRPINGGYDDGVLQRVQLLSPDQIDLVLQRLLPFMRTGELHPDSIGTYATALVQKSYHYGNNDFTIHTQNVPLDFMCSNLKGDEKKPLNMILYGDTGDCTGSFSMWCSFKQKGNAGNYYFCWAKNDELFISGGVEANALSFAQDTIFRTTTKGTFDKVRAFLDDYADLKRRRLYFVDSVGNALDRYSEQKET